MQLPRMSIRCQVAPRESETRITEKFLARPDELPRTNPDTKNPTLAGQNLNWLTVEDVLLRKHHIIRSPDIPSVTTALSPNHSGKLHIVFSGNLPKLGNI